jgi:hypothetical protein
MEKYQAVKTALKMRQSEPTQHSETQGIGGGDGRADKADDVHGADTLCFAFRMLHYPEIQERIEPLIIAAEPSPLDGGAEIAAESPHHHQDKLHHIEARQAIHHTRRQTRGRGF